MHTSLILLLYFEACFSGKVVEHSHSSNPQGEGKFSLMFDFRLCSETTNSLLSITTINSCLYLKM